MRSEGRARLRRTGLQAGRQGQPAPRHSSPCTSVSGRPSCSQGRTPGRPPQAESLPGCAGWWPTANTSSSQLLSTRRWARHCAQRFADVTLTSSPRLRAEGGETEAQSDPPEVTHSTAREPRPSRRGWTAEPRPRCPGGGVNDGWVPRSGVSPPRSWSSAPAAGGKRWLVRAQGSGRRSPAASLPWAEPPRAGCRDEAGGSWRWS